ARQTRPSQGQTKPPQTRDASAQHYTRASWSFDTSRVSAWASRPPMTFNSSRESISLLRNKAVGIAELDDELVVVAFETVRSWAVNMQVPFAPFGASRPSPFRHAISP